MEQAPAISNAEIVERFLAYISSHRRYSPLTVRNYARDIEEFVSWGEQNVAGRDFSLQELRTEDLREWIMYLSEQRELSAASVNRTVASLRSLYRYLRSEQIVERDVFASIPSLRTPRRLPKFVPEGEMVEVVDCVVERLQGGEWRERRDAMMVLLLYACGIRLAELAGINDEDFENDFATLRVRGKGDKERVVPVLEYVREKILRHLDTISRLEICIFGEKALFLTKKGSRISRSTVQRIVQRMLSEAEVQGKKSPHVLRHTYATHLMNGGADMRAIQELMGHASLRSTQIYTHNSIAQLAEAYQAAHPRNREERG